LEDWLGDDPSLERFVGLVCRSTGGNPFFMEEVVQAQIESGALVGARGRFRLEHPLESVEVPASVQSLLAARIDRLDETSKELLQTAAVIGDEVPEVLLERVSGLGRDELLGSLRGLVQSEFLYEAVLYPESEYAFKHPLTREVAYASLLKERRRALHANVAKSLEALAGDAVEQRAALLAHHWEEAGHKLEAARWQARTAARLRMNAGESIFHWRKVTELLAEGADEPEARALLGEARSRLVYAAGRSGASDAEVARLFEEARSAHGDTDSREHALTLASYSILRSGAGAIPESHRLVAEGVAMARRLGDPDALAATLGASTLVHLAMDFPEEHARLREEIDLLCAGDPSLGEELAGFRAWVVVSSLGLMKLLRLGAGDAIDAALLEARRRMEDDPQPMHRVLFHLGAAQLQARRGDAEGALEHGRQGNDAGTRAKNLALQVLGGVARVHGLLSADRNDDVRRQLDTTLPLALRHMKQTAASWVFPLVAELELREGNAEAARTAAERGIELTKTMGFRYSEARNSIQLARAFVAGGEAERAEETLARTSELARALDARDHLAALEEVRAELAALRGDTAGTARAWREAARRHRENGEEWLARQAEARIAS
ncbi:MAG: hypothetical protein ABFS41_12835, partial [Myxococcota bacterium]